MSYDRSQIPAPPDLDELLAASRRLAEAAMNAKPKALNLEALKRRREDQSRRALAEIQARAELSAPPGVPAPWLRLSNESERAFQAFAMYSTVREQLPTLRSVAEALGIRRQVVERWSSQFHWTRRRKAWIDHLTLARFQAQIEEVQGEARGGSRRE